MVQEDVVDVLPFKLGNHRYAREFLGNIIVFYTGTKTKLKKGPPSIVSTSIIVYFGFKFKMY